MAVMPALRQRNRQPCRPMRRLTCTHSQVTTNIIASILVERRTPGSINVTIGTFFPPDFVQDITALNFSSVFAALLSVGAGP